MIVECGESDKLKPSPYIIRGDIVESTSNWPWMVAVYFSGEYAGAGVYIGGGWVVSAAHLVRVQRRKNGVLFTERQVIYEIDNWLTAITTVRH